MKKIDKQTILIVLILISMVIIFILFNKLSNQIFKPKQITNLYGQLNKNAPKETSEFGQLVGVWDCTISNLNNEGIWIDSKAEWTWKYILDGYAIQDFWSRKANREIDSTLSDYYGTNVRIFDPQKKKWIISWAENGKNSMSGLWEANIKEDKTIEIYDNTNQWLITFFNIKEKTFDWKWDFRQKDSTMKTMVKIKAIRNTRN